ncbi:16202_t:CDS:2, partial [Racocetra persica]
KKQNEEYVSLLNDVRDYFRKSWYIFLNDCEEAKQFNDYSRYLVDDILKEDQVDNEIKEVIDLTNEEGVIDKVEEVDKNLYTEQVYSNEDLYIDPKVPVDNTENLDNQEVNNIENLDNQEVPNYVESLDSEKDELDHFKIPAEIPEDEYDFLNFSD